jgi:hypothetical protein
MPLERLDGRCRKHRHAILPALAVAHEDLPILEVDVFDAKLQALAQPEAGAIKQARHQPLRALHLSE